MSTGSANPGSLRRVFHVVSPTCEDMTKLISAMLDRQLPLRTRLRMRVHFLYCSSCRRFRTHLGLLHRAAARLDVDESRAGEEELDSAAKEKLRSLLRRQS